MSRKDRPLTRMSFIACKRQSLKNFPHYISSNVNFTSACLMDNKTRELNKLTLFVRCQKVLNAWNCYPYLLNLNICTNKSNRQGVYFDASLQCSFTLRHVRGWDIVVGQRRRRGRRGKRLRNQNRTVFLFRRVHVVAWTQAWNAVVGWVLLGRGWCWWGGSTQSITNLFTSIPHIPVASQCSFDTVERERIRITRIVKVLQIMGIIIDDLIEEFLRTLWPGLYDEKPKKNKGYKRKKSGLKS